MRCVDFDIGLAQPRMRSVRVNGITTSFRLEEVYWIILNEIAQREGISVSQLLSDWARHVDMTYGRINNLSSYVRISCLVYLLGSCPIDRASIRQQDLRELCSVRYPLPCQSLHVDSEWPIGAFGARGSDKPRKTG